MLLKICDQSKPKEADLSGVQLRGKDFKKLYGDEFYKYINASGRQGMNICKKGKGMHTATLCGWIYFVGKEKIYEFYKATWIKIAFIEIPDDAQVCIDYEGVFKADKIIVTDIFDVANIPDEFWHMLLPNDLLLIRYFKNPSEDLLLEVVSQYGLALEFIKDQFQTKTIVEFAIAQNPTAIRFVKKDLLTIDLCQRAVRQNAATISIVNEKLGFISDELCANAVQQQYNQLYDQVLQDTKVQKKEKTKSSFKIKNIKLSSIIRI